MAFSENDVPNLGFYNWTVVDNCLTGDAIFASLYGFTLDEVVRGVTTEDVMARIIPGDRERVAFEVTPAYSVVRLAPSATPYLTAFV